MYTNNVGCPYPKYGTPAMRTSPCTSEGFYLLDTPPGNGDENTTGYVVECNTHIIATSAKL